MKPAANMIMHSTRSHFAQRKQSHVERVFAGSRGIGILPILSRDWLEANATIARVESREKIERHRPGKLWSVTEAAFFRIVTALNLPISGIQDRCVDFPFCN
jgi:hypothetical protein